jgi:hypothetical protein
MRRAPLQRLQSPASSMYLSHPGALRGNSNRLRVPRNHLIAKSRVKALSTSRVGGTQLARGGPHAPMSTGMPAQTSSPSALAAATHGPIQSRVPINHVGTNAAQSAGGSQSHFGRFFDVAGASPPMDDGCADGGAGPQAQTASSTSNRSDGDPRRPPRRISVYSGQEIPPGDGQLIGCIGCHTIVNQGTDAIDPGQLESLRKTYTLLRAGVDIAAFALGHGGIDAIEPGVGGGSLPGTVTPTDPVPTTPADAAPVAPADGAATNPIDPAPTTQANPDRAPVNPDGSTTPPASSDSNPPPGDNATSSDPVAASGGNCNSDASRKP